MEEKSKQKNKKQFQTAKRKKPSESEHRMKFLMNAASCVLESTGNPILAAAYTHHCTIVGQKGQVRLHRDVKRTICKGCHGLLVSGKTATTKVNGPKKKRKLDIVCKVCYTKKSFLLEKNKNKEKKELALKNKKLKQESLKEKKKENKELENLIEKAQAKENDLIKEAEQRNANLTEKEAKIWSYKVIGKIGERRVSMEVRKEWKGPLQGEGSAAGLKGTDASLAFSKAKVQDKDKEESIGYNKRDMQDVPEIRINNCCSEGKVEDKVREEALKEDIGCDEGRKVEDKVRDEVIVCDEGLVGKEVSKEEVVEDKVIEDAIVCDEGLVGKEDIGCDKEEVQDKVIEDAIDDIGCDEGEMKD